MFKKYKGSDIMILFGYMAPEQKKYIFYIILGSLLEASAANLMALSLRNLVLSATEKDSKYFTGLVLMNVAAFFLFTFCAFVRKGHVNCVNRMMARIRQTAYDKIGKLPIGYYEKNLSGDLLSKVTNDINTFRPLFMDLMPEVIGVLIYGIVSTITALIINWWLAAVICILGVAFKLMNDYLAKAVKKYSNTAYEKSAVLVQELISILTGHTIIKIFGLEEKTYEAYRIANQEYTDTSVTLTLRKSYQNASNSLLTSFLNIFTMVLGAYLVFSSILSLPTILVVNSLAVNISMMFRWTGQIFSEAVSTSVAGVRIHKILETEEEPTAFATPDTLPSPYELQFEEVSFAYDGEVKNVLNHINLSIEKGKIIALVGESGGGKSTIMKLLLGFYPIISGNIWVRQKCLAQYSLEELRNQFAYVSQDSYLFDGTIVDNIRYGNVNATMDEMIEAAKVANAHDFILEQEKGYDTVVGERAVKLSGGQKQRIAIARAILKNAPILLLDEATSSLDAEAQELVQNALKSLMKNRTTIVIAHRLSTIENADEILVISNGEIVEKGRHEELYELGKKYYELYNLQFA